MHTVGVDSMQSDSAAVRKKFLELIQIWAIAFQKEPAYKVALASPVP